MRELVKNFGDSGVLLHVESGLDGDDRGISFAVFCLRCWMERAERGGS